MHEHDIARAAAKHHGAHGGHGVHGGHDKHAGHDPEVFRRRFWLSLLLTIPIVVTSEMVMDWFGYELDFAGMAWVGPVSARSCSSGAGGRSSPAACAEIRDRQPGMMLLIAMAITVAYAASMATSLGWFDLDFWWELAALVTIMLLGHWQEMKAIGQAQGALAALAALLPDEAEVVDGDDVDRAPRRAPRRRRRAGASRRARAGRRPDRRGRGRARRVDDHRRIPAGRQGAGDRVVAGTVSTDSSIRVRVDAVGDDTALAGIQRLVADAQSSRSRAQVLADRFAALLFYVAAAARSSRSWCGRCSATSTTPSSGRSRCSSSPARTRSGWRSRS